MPTCIVAPDVSGAARDAAAGIWARATARRDDDPDPATPAEARPVIDRAMQQPRAALLSAVRAGRTVGFATVAAHGETSVEITYLGVDPTDWGTGVVGELLDAVERHGADHQAREVFLWVYADNLRAVTAYRRAGFDAFGDVREHASSGRTEQRMRRVLANANGNE